MPTFNFSGRRGAWLIGLCLVAAVAASLHFFAQEAARFAASHVPTASSAALDALRERAEAGDGEAAVTLASSLISRYERTSERDDLYEAAIWVDRAWFSDDAPRHHLIDRLYGRYCGDKVMQWHWMCHNGE